MILRPYGIVIDGHLEIGLELEIENGVIQEIRPHTGIPELYIISPAFINAHSHLEYRFLQGKIHEREYWAWIREITSLKKEESPDQIRSACLLAAAENCATGVAAILEHNDRTFSGIAMNKVGLKGMIFREVITILERDTAAEKLEHVRENAAINAKSFQGPVYLNPHAYQTVDRQTLTTLAELNTPLSIHVAETDYENELTRTGSGPIADFYKANGVPVEPTGKSALASLDDLGLMRENTQLVHCCALDQSDIELISKRGANVAHCPRSNLALGCPPAPIRELLDADIHVGLGLDSAGSSGPIDMFAEMRAALQTSNQRGRPVTAEEVWKVATNIAPVYRDACNCDSRITRDAAPRLIKIHVQDAHETEQIIEQAHPGLVEWI